jgi:hypothetical protein
LAREQKTVAAMIRPLPGHTQWKLACAEAQDYALHRIEHCPFGPGKPVCSKCRVHCYGAEQRERIRRVMRYAGPRMLLAHPLLALLHLRDAGRAQK